MRRKAYLLTPRAAADLREARAWSRAQWGKALTDRYFEDLHEGAQHIAENYASLRDRNELAGAPRYCCIRSVSTTSSMSPSRLI